jgi:hypothetical protein
MADTKQRKTMNVLYQWQEIIIDMLIIRINKINNIIILVVVATRKQNDNIKCK